MRIALDFDDTYTRDPIFWENFVGSAIRRGHDVRIVTFRSKEHNNSDLEELLNGVNIKVIYTGAHKKRPYCAKIGWLPEVWIDDMPDLIVEDAYVPGELLARQQSYDGE